MSRHRFFVGIALPLDEGDFAIPLSEADTHHALHVLRVQPGEEIVVVEPGGRSRIVEIASVGADAATGRLAGELPAPVEPRITLLQGIVKGSVMDDIVQHAVELGAERIVPLSTERTIVRLDRAKAAARTSRWQRIAEGAAKQSQRTRVPLVDLPRDLAGASQLLADADIAVVLWEESEAESLWRVLVEAGITAATPQARVTLVVGPEGGLTAAEVATLIAAGAVVASLGTAILRAETAALAAMTLAAQALGALGSAQEAS